MTVADRRVGAGLFVLAGWPAWGVALSVVATVVVVLDRVLDGRRV